MRTSIIVNNQEIEFSRNPFTGSFTYKINGQEKTLDSALNPLTHYSVTLTRVYELPFENSVIKIIKTRPLLFAGFRPHKFEFYNNDKLIKEVNSY